MIGKRRLAKNLGHPRPIIRRERLFDQFHAQLPQGHRVGDRLGDVPAAIGIYPEHGVGMAARARTISRSSRRAQLDLVDRPAGELLELGHHAVDGIDADRVVGRRQPVQRESPQFPNPVRPGLSPKICQAVSSAHWANRQRVESEGETPPTDQAGSSIERASTAAWHCRARRPSAGRSFGSRRWRRLRRIRARPLPSSSTDERLMDGD